MKHDSMDSGEIELDRFIQVLTSMSTIEWESFKANNIDDYPVAPVTRKSFLRSLWAIIKEMF